jgi:hypothetical protein
MAIDKGTLTIQDSGSQEFIEESGSGNDDVLLKGIAEFCMGNPTIREDLEYHGFSRLEPPFSGYVMETIPPGISSSEMETWKKAKVREKLEFYANLDDDTKQGIEADSVDYNKAVEYVKLQVLETLDTIRDSRFGVREVFERKLRGENIEVQDLIGIMTEHDIKVEQMPDREAGFGLPDNHGQSRYTKDGWKARFNKTALEDPSEVMHELAAIEVFDSVMRESKQSSRENPLTLFAKNIAYRRTKQELEAIHDTSRKGDLRLPIIDKLFLVTENWSEEAPVQNYLRKALGIEVENKEELN